MAFSGCFQANKVGSGRKADGETGAQAPKWEATWHVQGDNQIDTAVCERGCGWRGKSGLCVKILVYQAKKLILNPVEHCLPNFSGDKELLRGLCIQIPRQTTATQNQDLHGRSWASEYLIHAPGIWVYHERNLSQRSL